MEQEFLYTKKYSSTDFFLSKEVHELNAAFILINQLDRSNSQFFWSSFYNKFHRTKMAKIYDIKFAFVITKIKNNGK